MAATIAGRLFRVAGAALGAFGGLLAVAGTLAAVPYAPAVLLVGLAAVGLALPVGAWGFRVERRRVRGDALVVRGGFWLHLAALALAIALWAVWAVTDGDGVPWRGLCWGAGALGYAGLSYVWDRSVETDVDAG